MAGVMFGKRHYQAIGAVLREERPDGLLSRMEEWEEIVDRLSDLFEADNEDFDLAKWEEACGR